MQYWWGYRRNLKLITLGSERVSCTIGATQLKFNFQLWGNIFDTHFRVNRCLLHRRSFPGFINKNNLLVPSPVRPVVPKPVVPVPPNRLEPVPRPVVAVVPKPLKREPEVLAVAAPKPAVPSWVVPAPKLNPPVAGLLVAPNSPPVVPGENGHHQGRETRPFCFWRPTPVNWTPRKCAFFAVRSPRFWVSGYCTKWRIQGQFW